MTRTLLAATLAAITLAGCATAPQATRTVDGVLVNEAGMTLYTFDKDTAGKSNCNGQCAVNWPPLKAGADASAHGAYTVVTREDGSKQWAYKGKPLYTWIKDQKAGDKTGDGVNNVWHLAKE